MRWALGLHKDDILGLCRMQGPEQLPTVRST